ncbi:MAG: FAD-binding oxidoreductase [Candidatus Heimdallarchaeaceae archaeon]
MTLKRKTRARFMNYFKDQFRDDLVTKYLYSTDFSSLSKIRLINKKTNPDGVILIKSLDDLRKTFEIAKKSNVKLIPRMNGTTLDGGSLAYNGGVILELRGLTGEVFLEPGEPSISVPASMTFAEIRKYLKWNGFDLCSYPINVHAASVGGWISTGGYGIGSTSYGGIEKQLLELEIISPNGGHETISDPSKIGLFVGSHGKLGIITRAKLKIRFDSPLVYRICMFDSIKDVIQALPSFQDLDPFSVVFYNPHLMREINTSFNFHLPERYILIVVKEAHFDEEEHRFYRNFNSIVRKTNAELIDMRHYKGLWEIQEKLIKVLKSFHTFIPQMLKFDLVSAAKLIKSLESKFKGKLYYAGTLIPSKRISLFSFLGLKSKPSALAKLRLVFSFYNFTIKIAKKTVQGAYSSGLWYGGYDTKEFSKEIKDEFTQIKAKNDPKGIINRYSVFRRSITLKLLQILSRIIP